MARFLTATAVLLAALVCTTGARLPLAAMAPAPAMEGGKMPKADLTFILSADTASFTPEGTLVLSNPAQSTAFTAKHGQSGIYPTSYFTDVSPGSKFVSADGKWLDMPQAALWGASAQGGNQSVVLLALGSPTFNADAKTLTFPYQFLAPTHTSVKYAGGSVAHVVKEAESNTGLNAIGQILPNMSMTGAALFIDSNSMAMQPKADTKTWWFPWWGGGYNNCWNCGYGYNNGYYNNGYYNNGGGYYNNNNNNNNNGYGGNNNNNNNNNGRH